MPELSLSNIDQIARDISSEEITFSHLLNELIDHVCCDVENEMQKGLSFHEAYSRVKNKMGPRRLKEIQEETLFLVDTKYRNMKNLMKVSGVAGTVLLGFAALFKINHWPLAGIMLTLGALLTAFVFLPSALGVIWKESHSGRRLFLYISAFLSGMFFILGVLFKIQHWPAAGIILSLAIFCGVFLFIPALLSKLLGMKGEKGLRKVYIIAAFGLICYAGGMLFKIQHWPGAAVLLLLGVAVISLAAIPLYTFNKWKDEKHIRGEFLFIIIGMLAIVLPGTLVNLNLSNSFDRDYYYHLDRQQSIFVLAQNNNATLLKELADSSNSEVLGKLSAKTTDLLAVIEKVEKKLVSETEGKPGMPAADPVQLTKTESGLKIDYANLSFPFNPYHSRNNIYPGTDGRKSIDAALADYVTFIDEITGATGGTGYSGMLAAEAYLPAETVDGRGVSLLSALHSLELLKNSIVAAEYSVIKKVTLRSE